MKLFEVNSNEENTIYFMMVYANPPTYGYKLAYEKLLNMAGTSDHAVFINPMQDETLNPLPHEKTLRYNMKIFPNVTFYKRSDKKNALEALQYLSEKYSNIYLVTSDENVSRYQRFYNYAERWGVFNFDIIGLGDSQDPIDPERKNSVARQAVLDNQYEVFKKTIPTRDENVISKLYLDMRKSMLGLDESRAYKYIGEYKQDKFDIFVEKTIQFIYERNNGIKILKEFVEKDPIDNTIFSLSHISPKVKIDLVLTEKAEDFSLGYSELKNRKVIFINSTIDKLDEKLELNKEKFKTALRGAVKLKESTTAGAVSTVNSVLGQPIRRVEKFDLSFVDKIKKDDKNYSKLQTAMKEFIDTHGYIDSNAIEKIKKRLGV